MRSLSCLLLLFLTPVARAQAPAAPPKYEFRGTWIATVANLDWPDAPTASPRIQQAQLIEMLDALQAAGINAVFFQVRSECDALYASEIEPWSYWLTGRQGRAPDPAYDPLAFAVEEAHRRGMELHAWFNPYLAVRNTNGYAQDATHVSLRHPEWILTFGTFKILDPGLPEVRDYVTGVILDVARRYEIDGVHFDDFFYPYPPNQITDEDDATFARHGQGFASRGDWRRDNVNRFVAQVRDSLQAVRPALKFGISPFGIWKNGVPAGIVGLDAYNVIYADATAWLADGFIDYLAPQLYWAFGGGQDYGSLALWWAGRRSGRHLYPGHAVYKAEPATYGGTLYAPDEVPRQVRFNRRNPDISGSAFYRAKNITALRSSGFADSLAADLFRYPALTPVMSWKDPTQPGAPTDLAYVWNGDEVTFTWRAPEASGAPARRYAVYRVQSGTPPDAAAVLADANHLLTVTGETTFTDRPGAATEPYYYVVTALSANSVESLPGDFVRLEGRPVAVEREQPAAPVLLQNIPNPFNAATEVRFTLDRPARVSLRVYNLLGQEVAVLIEDAWWGPGTHALRWDGRDARGMPAGSGAYLYTLEAGGRRATEGMVLIR